MSTREGWLEKKSIFGMWSKRYFVLNDSKLSVYKIPSATKPENIFQLDSQTTVEMIGTNDHRLKIIIQKPKVISLILRASSNDEMTDWIFHLRCSAFANKTMYMSMFNIISILGCGFYGKVMLCEKKDSNEIVAIKAIKKDKSIKTDKMDSILNERKVLTAIHNPFIISLKYAFQTNKKYYIALEYEPGGDLFHKMKSGPVKLNDVKIYIAELSIAINELHNNNIIYRDMKPENVMIDKDGHLKLTDFGLSCFTQPGEILKSVCGTPEYIAPEVLLGQGYGRKIDWWGIGLLTYELLYRTTPFSGMNNQYIYQSILKKEPIYPKDADPSIIDFISTLLQKDPEKRGGFRFIVHSEFMKDIDFRAVYEKKISPSFIPEVKNIRDTSNFDLKYTKEKACDSDSSGELGLENNHIDGFSFYGTTDNIILNDQDYKFKFSSSKLVSSQSSIVFGEIGPLLMDIEKDKSEDSY